jgi:HSP20 family molecular chaperone IbpA
MKKLVLLMIFLLANIFASKLYAQDEQFQKQVEEIMKAREEMLNSLINGNGDMEQKMLEMMRRFSQQGGLPSFDDEELGGPVVGEYDWIVTDAHKILKIKVKQLKDRPLDIKIEKGMLKIKGDVESTQGAGKKKIVRKVNFERSFSLPDDVDQTSPEFENKDGEFLIKFKRLAITRFKKTVPTAPIKKSDERVPVSPNSDDLNI